jgi:hypothetical protein
MNSRPALILHRPDDTRALIIMLEVGEGGIQRLRAVAIPDNLQSA